MSRNKKNIRAFLFYIFLTINPSFAKELTVTFIDVGQGDSIFIETPDGKNVLIDGGGIPSWRKRSFRIGAKVVTPFLKKKNIKQLDMVILTHGHTDHVDGLIDVLRAFPVKEVVDTREGGGNVTDDEYIAFLETVQEKNIHYRIVEEGATLDFGKEVSTKILNPPRGFCYPDINDNSLVIKLDYKAFAVLLTADIGSVTERDLIARYGGELRAQILKVGHHGSKTSTCALFLETVGPEVAAVSCGRNNSFGHPHPEVIKRLKRKKIRIYATEKSGNITVTSDGEKYRIQTEYGE